VNIALHPTPEKREKTLSEQTPDTLSDSVRQNHQTEVALILGNKDKYLYRARQCHRRSHPLSPECKTPEAQQRNADRRDLYLEVLQLLGYAAQMLTGETVADNDIVLKKVGHPQLDEVATSRMQQILSALGETETKQPDKINEAIRKHEPEEAAHA